MSKKKKKQTAKANLTRLRKEFVEKFDKIYDEDKDDFYDNLKITDWKQGKAIDEYLKKVNCKDSYEKLSLAIGDICLPGEALSYLHKLYKKCPNFNDYKEILKLEKRLDKISANFRKNFNITFDWGTFEYRFADRMAEWKKGRLINAYFKKAEHGDTYRKLSFIVREYVSVIKQRPKLYLKYPKLKDYRKMVVKEEMVRAKEREKMLEDCR